MIDAEGLAWRMAVEPDVTFERAFSVDVTLFPIDGLTPSPHPALALNPAKARAPLS